MIALLSIIAIVALLLILLSIPPQEPRNPRKGQVTLIPDKYVDPWGHNARKRDIR